MARKFSTHPIPRMSYFFGGPRRNKSCLGLSGKKIVITVQKSAIVPFTLIVTFIDPVVWPPRMSNQNTLIRSKLQTTNHQKEMAIFQNMKTTKKSSALGHLHIMTCGAIIIQDIGSRLKEFLQNLGVELKQQWTWRITLLISTDSVWWLLAQRHWNEAIVWASNLLVCSSPICLSFVDEQHNYESNQQKTWLHL